MTIMTAKQTRNLSMAKTMIEDYQRTKSWFFTYPERACIGTGLKGAILDIGAKVATDMAMNSDNAEVRALYKERAQSFQDCLDEMVATGLVKAY